MASEIRANKQTNRAGLGTVTYTDTGIIVSGLVTATTFSGNVSATTVVADDFLNVGSNIKLGNAGVITATSFSGSGANLTGIDATALKDPGGDVIIQAQDSGAEFTGIHTFTTSGATLDGSGIKVSTGATISPIGNASFTGIVTASSFIGNGSNLTGIVGGKFGGGATGIQTVGNVGVQTANMTAPDLVGAASSLVGLYIGDGSLIFSNNLSRAGGYYITTGVNALNAGPVSLNTKMTLDGTWVIV